MLENKHVIGCKWVFKIKTRFDSSSERYKARLVVKGYSQEHEIDYDETCAPVAQMKTIHTLISISSMRRWHIEEVYMKPPPSLYTTQVKFANYVALYMD